MPSTTRKKSGNPAKKVSTAKSWRKQTSQIELELPSGEVCMVKRPGMPQLIAADVLPDMLTKIAQAAITKGQAGAVKEATADAHELIKELVQQPDGLANMMDSFSRVTAYCVVQPTCLYHRRKKQAGQLDQIQESYVPEWEDIPLEDRDENILYTDDVDLEDQMFIFQFVVGGSSDLTDFRQQVRKSLDGVVPEQTVEETPL